MAGTVDATLEAQLVSFRPQVRRHVLAMVKDPAEADELTQDTYARAIERIDQLCNPQAALAWLYRIATTVSLDRLRQRRLSTVNFEEAGGAAEEAVARESEPFVPESVLDRVEVAECLQRYLAALPDDHRVAILLHDVHGLPNAEIAELVGCSLAAAKIRVHRARSRLRETLEVAFKFEIDERGVLVGIPQPGCESL
jgi:RNA polymerase sigma-70 factor, ECF subfamily